MCYWEGGCWASDEFRVYDMEEFVAWARLWPEMDFQLCGDGDRARIFPAIDLDYAPSLPTFRCDPETGELLDEEERFEEAFLEELSWRVAVGETCVIRLVHFGWGEISGHAVAIVGGETPPAERILAMSLDEIHGRAADRLAGGRRLIGYAAE